MKHIIVVPKKSKAIQNFLIDGTVFNMEFHEEHYCSRANVSLKQEVWEKSKKTETNRNSRKHILLSYQNTLKILKVLPASEPHLKENFIRDIIVYEQIFRQSNDFREKNALSEANSNFCKNKVIVLPRN